MDTQIVGSPYRLQHGESLVGFTDQGVDFLVTVAGCCLLGAKIGEFFNILQVFFINHDWVAYSSDLHQNLSRHCVDLRTNSVGCFVKTFSIYGHSDVNWIEDRYCWHILDHLGLSSVSTNALASSLGDSLHSTAMEKSTGDMMHPC